MLNWVRSARVPGVDPARRGQRTAGALLSTVRARTASKVLEILDGRSRRCGRSSTREARPSRAGREHEVDPGRGDPRLDGLTPDLRQLLIEPAGGAGALTSGPRAEFGLVERDQIGLRSCQTPVPGPPSGAHRACSISSRVAPTPTWRQRIRHRTASPGLGRTLRRAADAEPITADGRPQPWSGRWPGAPCRHRR